MDEPQRSNTHGPARVRIIIDVSLTSLIIVVMIALIALGIL